MSWDVNTSQISKEEAIEEIKNIARAKGYQSFKVFYDGAIVANPSNLPETVDMEKVRVSAVMDQA